MKTYGAILLLIELVSAPAALSAEVAVTLDAGYAIWFPIRPVGWWFAEQDSLVVLGEVLEFAGPLSDLNHRPHPQDTFVLSGLVCTGAGTWHDPLPPGDGGVWADFTNGTLCVYRDISTAYRYDDRGTFADGVKIFEATCTQVSLVPRVNDEAICSLRFTGGTQFNLVSTNGVGFTGTVGMAFDDGSASIPAELQALGYRAAFNPTVYVNFPVATESATWGRLKTLYGH